jgi:hypothetical protein
MTPNKIKEAAENLHVHYFEMGEIVPVKYLEMGIKYGAEWVLSQASKGLDEWYSSVAKEIYKTPIPSDVAKTWQAARLSSAKEIMEKDALIKALEGELLKAFPMIKFLPDYAERFPFATKLVSKKEST